jgi:multidrug efflux pump subunit AcrA (membrane-fusion protein)
VERRVKVGARQGTMIEIVDGLRAGEQVVVAGFQKLATGTPVAVVN